MTTFSLKGVKMTAFCYRRGVKIIIFSSRRRENEDFFMKNIKMITATYKKHQDDKTFSSKGVKIIFFSSKRRQSDELFIKNVKMITAT